jgi:hypothetical protein
MAERRCDRLRALLEEEREVLAAGELERLSDLLERKETLADEIGRDGLEAVAGEADALRDMARRNSELLEAARSGLRGAIDRMAECARVSGRLDTYDADGQRRSLGGARHGLHRRA